MNVKLYFNCSKQVWNINLNIMKMTFTKRLYNFQYNRCECRHITNSKIFLNFKFYFKNYHTNLLRQKQKDKCNVAVQQKQILSILSREVKRDQKEQLDLYNLLSVLQYQSFELCCRRDFQPSQDQILSMNFLAVLHLISLLYLPTK